MKAIPSRPLRPAHYEGVERQLSAIFHDLLFRPLVEIIERATAQARGGRKLLNAGEDVLRQAIRSGRIQYADGVFFGQFSAVLSRALRAMGAKFDKRGGVYRLSPGNVPTWMTAEAVVRQAEARDVHRALQQELDRIEQDLERAVEARTVDASGTVGEFEKDWKAMAGALEVSPTLSGDALARLRVDYADNMKLWIGKFSKESIQSLRRVVQDNAEQGYRFDRLIDGIRHRHAVTENKAAFLARQETGLFMSKFRRERFGDAGITHYRWSTSHDERVRGRHRELNGTIQSYASPPIVDKNSGRRGNPGEDFNCRCVDIPIPGSVAEAA